MIKDKRALLNELQRVAESKSTLSIAVGHQKVEDVTEIVEDHGAFYLEDRHDKLLNFKKKRRLQDAKIRSPPDPHTMIGDHTQSVEP